MVLSGLASKILLGPLDPGFALSPRAWHCATVVSVTAAKRFMSVMIFAAFIGSCTPILVQSSFTPVHAARTVVDPTPHDVRGGVCCVMNPAGKSTPAGHASCDTAGAVPPTAFITFTYILKVPPPPQVRQSPAVEAALLVIGIWNSISQ